MHRKATRGPSNEEAGRFPAELEQFLSRKSYSLLIKGPSGSGKTILALTILGGLKKSENVLYISTRNSPVQLVKDYPWTRKIFGATSPTLGRGEATGRAQGWEPLIDARLDEPGIVFERITNILMDKQAPTVVLDSWESLDDTTDKDGLKTNITVLQTWRERAGARFIFVGIDATSTAIDAVVEGVVVLSEQRYQGRRLREISLSKLLGVQIPRPSYYFSLEGGVFHSFDRWRPGDFGPGAVPAKALGETGDLSRFGTSFRQLDETLGGGYQAGSVVWIEVDPRVDSKIAVAFIAGTIRDWASSGKRVVVQKSEEIDPGLVGQIRSSLGGRGAEKIMVWGSLSLDKWKEADKSAKEDASGLGSKSPESAKILSVVDWDKIARSAASAGAAGGVDAESVVNFLKGSAELSFVVARSNTAPQSLSGLVSAHIKISDINGTLFAMSEKPWSELFAIVSARGPKDGMELERAV